MCPKGSVSRKENFKRESGEIKPEGTHELLTPTNGKRPLNGKLANSTDGIRQLSMPDLVFDDDDDSDDDAADPALRAPAIPNGADHDGESNFDFLFHEVVSQHDTEAAPRKRHKAGPSSHTKKDTQDTCLAILHYFI